MNISTTQKLFVIMLVVAGGLVFYAVGIATNFFAQPIFSMFFVISYSTAHNIVVYIAIGAAIVISVPAITMYLRKRKTSACEMGIKPTVPLVQTQRKATASPNFVMIVEPSETVSTRKMTPIQSTQITMAPKSPVVSEPTIQRMPAKPEITPTIDNGDKLTCPSCGKEFTTPMLMLDYSSAKTDLVAYCPYCFERVGRQKKSE